MHTQRIYAFLIRKCLHFLQRGQQWPLRPRPETSRPRPEPSRPRPEPSRPRPSKIGLLTSQDRDRSRDFNIPGIWPNIDGLSTGQLRLSAPKVKAVQLILNVCFLNVTVCFELDQGVDSVAITTPRARKTAGPLSEEITPMPAYRQMVTPALKVQFLLVLSHHSKINNHF